MQLIDPLTKEIGLSPCREGGFHDGGDEALHGAGGPVAQGRLLGVLLRRRLASVVVNL